MTLRGLILDLRANRITRRAARERRRRLEHELAAYDTPAQRADLFAMLDRYPDGVTGELREILTRQAFREALTRQPFQDPPRR